MGLARGRRHRVVVVRVEVPGVGDSDMLIELLEVGHQPGGDRLLGRATTPADAARLLQNWLASLSP
jgi:hypothetical protein